MSDQNGMKRSLWDALHDATALEAVSDPMVRRASILLDISNLRTFARLRDNVRWRLTIDDAVLLLARTWEVWPGPTPDLRGLSREEESVVIAEYQAKGRTVSLGWNDFERATNSNGIWLLDANLQEGASGVVFSGHGHEENTQRYIEFEVTGRDLRCDRTDTGPVQLAELLQLGEAFWEHHAKPGPGEAD